jgi:hypothetical protein
MCAEQTTKVPAVIFDDYDDDKYSSRLIRGGRAKWVDKVWTLDGVLPREQDEFLIDGTGYVCQRFVDGKPEIKVKEPGKPWPDLDELNGPPEKWPIGRFGPEPPWKLAAFAYLLRLPSLAEYTHINSTWGTRICIRELRSSIRNMWKWRGPNAVPIVRLTTVVMQSKKYPGRFRPELEIVRWHQIADQPAQIEPPKEPPKQDETVGKTAKPATIKEEPDDEIPF